MILCDIGNSTYHFLVNEDEYKYSVEMPLDILPFNLSSKIYFISVNDKASNHFLNKFPHAIDLKKKIIIPSNYENTLGVDRMMASYSITNNIIVDFGSAITIDIIKNKHHMGGYILPGLFMLKKCYKQISSKLEFTLNTNIDLLNIPCTTNDAISSGIYNMIIQPIISLQNEYNLPLILTGNDGKDFLPYLSNSHYDKHLIFKHMKKFIQLEYTNDNNSTS